MGAGTHSNGAASGPQSLWGNPGSELVAGEGRLLFLLPPPQARGCFTTRCPSLFLPPFQVLLSPPAPPHLQRVKGWAPCVGAEQSEPFGLKNLQSHLTQPRDLSAPPSHPSWLQQSWAWWPLLVPSFLDRVSSPGFTLPSYTHPTPLPHTPKQSSLQELSCG